MDARHLLIPLAVILVAVGALVLLHDDGPDPWTISYEVDRGELPEDYITEYFDGDDVPLPEPSRYGYRFIGWFLGSDYRALVESTSDLSGDVTLYAWWNPCASYDILYELDGGRFDGDHPDSYFNGWGLELPIPVKDGYDFGGWFTDPELTRPIVVIDDKRGGDITVYACWTDPDRSGIGCEWNIHGIYYNGDIRHKVEGTMRQEMMAFVNGSHYYITYRDVEYTWPDGSTYDDSVRGEWTGEETKLEYVGIGNANGYDCTIWKDEDGNRYWLHHLWLQVRISVLMGATTITYDLTDVYDFKPNTSFTPEVSAEHPLTVSGVGGIHIGDPLTLTADGDGFTGWYVNGEQVSTERTFTFDMMDPEQRIDARAGESFIVLEPVTDSLESMGFKDATIVDSDGEPITSILSDLEPGLYTATVVDSGYERYLRFFIDTSRTFSHTWTYSGIDHTVSFDILYSDVFRYDYENPYPFRMSMSDQGYVDHYHTFQDRYLKSLVETLRSEYGGDDPRGFAEFVLYFVQSIDYRTDLDVYGKDECWAFPLEYLWNDGGDCEDSSILYNTLMGIAGYDVALIVFTDHAMSGISVDGGGRNHLTEDGTRYYFCETTNTGSDGKGFRIGDTSSGHGTKDVFFWTPVTVQE